MECGHTIVIALQGRCLNERKTQGAEANCEEQMRNWIPFPCYRCHRTASQNERVKSSGEIHTKGMMAEVYEAAAEADEDVLSIH